MDYELSVDWLSFTFAHEGEFDETIQSFLNRFQFCFPDSVQNHGNLFEDGNECYETEVSFVNLNKGFLGFTNSYDICLDRQNQLFVIGKLAYGGTSQKNKVYFSLNSDGSKMMNLNEMRMFLLEIDARITRIDLAFDDYKGNFPVENAVEEYKNGELFKTRAGRPPKAKYIDDLGNETGKTFYVGTRESGKMLRAYEKGLQLKQKGSKWIRYEVEIHNTGREIPLDILSDIKSFYLGSYKYLEATFKDVINAVDTKIIKCSRRKVGLIVDHFVKVFSNQYGKLFNYLKEIGVNAESFSRMIRRDGTPVKFLKNDLNYVTEEFYNLYKTSLN